MSEFQPPPPEALPGGLAGRDLLRRHVLDAVFGPTPSRRFGRYELREPLGSGAMGIVYLAHDAELDRLVAIKILGGVGGSSSRPSGAARSQAFARVVREAQAMARLSHPNVVPVYDFGFEDEQPYIVMEYVEGPTLSAWLRESNPSGAEILRMFAGAGRGLAAVHELDVLHRDFKPTNVLVDASGRPRITDFGLARTELDTHTPSPAASMSGSFEDTLTRTGTVMGTPRYMAPEQHTGAVLGPAADQYAFCVSLWEALGGAPPFNGARMLPDKRRGPPAWPGFRPGLDLSSARQRRVVAAIRRGLAPDPLDRWPTMDALVRALEHRSPGGGRVWVFATGGAGCIAALVAGSLLGAKTNPCGDAPTRLDVAWDEARRADIDRAMRALHASYATEAWARVEPRLDDYARAWSAQHDEVCAAVHITSDPSARTFDVRMACLNRARAELAATTELLADADGDVARRAHELVDRLPDLSRCAQVDDAANDHPPPPPDVVDAVARIRSLLAAAAVARAIGRYEDARARVDEARAALATIDYAPLAVDVALEHGLVLDALGEYEEAEDALRDAIFLASTIRRWDAVGAAAAKLSWVVGTRLHRFDEGLEWLRHPEVARALEEGGPEQRATIRTYLGSTLLEQGDFDSAEVEHRLALALREAMVPPDPLAVADSREHLARVMLAQGEYADAAVELQRVHELRRAALPADHPDVAIAHMNTAAPLLREARFAEAEVVLRAVVQELETSLGPAHPEAAGARLNLGLALTDLGRYEEAEAELQRSLELRLAALGPDHLDVGAARSALAGALEGHGRYAEAEAQHRIALAQAERILGPDHPDTLSTRGSLANVLEKQGRFDESVAEHRRVVATLEASLGHEHPSTALAHNNLAIALEEQGDFAEAEAEYREALAIRERVLDPDHMFLAASRVNLAGFLEHRGAHAESLALAELAWRRVDRDDVAPEHKAQTARALALASWGVGGERREEARAWARRAIEEYRRAAEANPMWNSEVGAIEAWLRETRAAG